MSEYLPDIRVFVNWPVCPFHGSELSLQGEPAKNAAGHRFVWSCPHCKEGEITGSKVEGVETPIQQPIKGNYGFRDSAP